MRPTLILLGCGLWCGAAWGDPRASTIADGPNQAQVQHLLPESVTEKRGQTPRLSDGEKFHSQQTSGASSWLDPLYFEAASTRNVDDPRQLSETSSGSDEVASPEPLPPLSPASPPKYYPPFSPLAEGVTVVSMPATMIQIRLNVSGDLTSFGPFRQQNITEALSDYFACYEPNCRIELRITAASVAITAIITIPDSVPAQAANVVDVANDFAHYPIGNVSNILGVSVISPPVVSVKTGVVTPIAVAPPPPPAAPPEPPAPPMSPPPPATPPEPPMSPAPPLSPPPPKGFYMNGPTDWATPTCSESCGGRTPRLIDGKKETAEEAQEPGRYKNLECTDGGE
jgi:hypothetical protein